MANNSKTTKKAEAQQKLAAFDAQLQTIISQPTETPEQRVKVEEDLAKFIFGPDAEVIR